MRTTFIQQTILFSCISILILLGTSLKSFGQTKHNNLKQDFYKSKLLFNEDVEVFKLFKKTRRQRRTAATLGILSLVSIGSGTYAISLFEDNGQSADIAIVVSALGLYGVGILTGIPAMVYHFLAIKSRNNTITLYQEKFGFGAILNPLQSETHIMRININNNRIGLVMSF